MCSIFNIPFVAQIFLQRSADWHIAKNIPKTKRNAGEVRGKVVTLIIVSKIYPTTYVRLMLVQPIRTQVHRDPIGTRYLFLPRDLFGQIPSRLPLQNSCRTAVSRPTMASVRRRRRRTSLQLCKACESVLPTEIKVCRDPQQTSSVGTVPAINSWSYHIQAMLTRLGCTPRMYEAIFQTDWRSWPLICKRHVLAIRRLVYELVLYPLIHHYKCLSFVIFDKNLTVCTRSYELSIFSSWMFRVA